MVDPALASRLDRLGYGSEGETLTLFGVREELDIGTDPRVEIASTPGDDWLAAKAELTGLSAAQTVTLRETLSRLALPAAFACLRVDGRVASLAYIARRQGLLVVESVVTAAPLRGQGLARRMLSTLLASELAAGCTAACLQVQADNTPAIALYRGLGLTTELYRYHYRRERRSA
jgi:ribosomal protein S18 acetylase RimI-like enzyme